MGLTKEQLDELVEDYKTQEEMQSLYSQGMQQGV